MHIDVLTALIQVQARVTSWQSAGLTRLNQSNSTDRHSPLPPYSPLNYVGADQLSKREDI